MRDADLLFEIGSEEIPARMLARALAELPAQVEAALASARLAHGDIRVYGTPRRLAVWVGSLVHRQADLRERVVGPPAAAAYKDGKPTQAALGFAQKNGVDPSALTLSEVPGKKGQYVVAETFAEGEPTQKLLPDLLAGLLSGIAWPKSMRWGWADEAYVRPIQWLVALYGGEVVPVTWRGVRAGRVTRGHRFLAKLGQGSEPTPIELAAPTNYVDALREAHVYVDAKARRDAIETELRRVEIETGLRLRKDDALLDEVTGLVEYPVAVVGTFDRSHLEIPEEIIVTAMRTHQRYFALEDAAGKLANRFVTIAGTIVRDVRVVEAGNARVLAARLADARYFFLEDKKRSLEAWNNKLEHVVFQAKFGDAAKTTGAKIRRIEALVKLISTERLVASAESIAAAGLAARYCKADLASGVVGEFPELQGVMGMHYAGVDAELAQVASRSHADTKVVAQAIADHYKPKGQGAPLPETLEGALVGIADRMDTLVGCFSVGLEPSGSADPYGLRRAALAIIAILLDRGPSGPRYVDNSGWPLSLLDLVRMSQQTYGDTLSASSTSAAGAATNPARLFEFLRARLRGILVEEGLAVQDVDAALGASGGQGWAEPCDARLRARSLAAVPSGAREVFKRVANILDDAKAKGFEPLPLSPNSHAEFAQSPAVEKALWAEVSEKWPELCACTGSKRYPDMFKILVELQPLVAAYFDKGGVMVMDPDPAVRAKRLGLLHLIREPFGAVADFRLLAGATP